MAHIVIDARIINSSTGRYIERLLHYLQKVDVLNSYTVLLRKKDLKFWKPTNNNFITHEADFDSYSIAEQRGLKKLLDTLKPDLVHFCMPQQPVFYKGKHITTFHDLTLLHTYNSDKNWLRYHLKQLIGRFVLHRVAHTSTLLLTPSQFTRDAVIDELKADPRDIRVTYESADIVNQDNASEYPSPFKQYLLYVGQQSDYKNIKRLARAHQELLKTYPELGLILVGNKNASVLINETYFNKKQYKNIHFTGFLPDDQRDWLYEHCAAYVFPSLMEGFGLPGLEAMGYGAPVVSSSATCLPEIYQDAAYYFDPKDVNDMIRAISDVLKNPELRENLIIKGYEQLKKYSWRYMAEQTHVAYMDALKRES